VPFRIFSMVSLSPSLKARLSTSLKIGSFEVKSRVLQSPLSGVTDLVFRRLVRRYAIESIGVMCSRGTLGYPFLVGEIDYFLKTGEQLTAPTAVDRLECAKEHLQALWQYKGDRGIQQSRKHMTWYTKGFSGAAQLRGQLAVIETVDQGVELIEQAIAQLINTSIQNNKNQFPSDP
jgi:tRNA-dihydrouridine synthase